ncbi:hypothetical protein HN873_044363 [Arachis hypogaea]
MKRNGRRSEQVFPLEVCIVDDRSRKHSYPKGPNKNSLPPLLSLSISQAMVVVNGWFEDEILNLRTCREPPISEDLRDLKYYMHDIGMIDAAREVMLIEIVDEAKKMITIEESQDEDTLARDLSKS